MDTGTLAYSGKSLKVRRNRHFYRAGNGENACPRFWNAIRKYGRPNFKWKVLAKFSLKVMAYHHEYVLVDHTQTRV